MPTLSMTPERWQQIETLYHAVLEIEPAERSSFIAEACGDDEDMRVRLERMLAQDTSTSKILDKSAAGLLKTEPLTIGTHLGPYRIQGFLGAGGMGRVFRAEDTRLQREVAIKVTSERFSERFEREARAIAALNHPNVCTLHDVGPDYLVMELVEGESPRGPMPLGQAIPIARQIVEALEAAHEKGIVHRDLKPANIKVKADGTVKVLDFGLAKQRPQPGAPPASVSESGAILGTAPYMSPEQIRGAEVDKRTDIWAFGVVLYELLTGRRPFEGPTSQDTMAEVLTKEPDWRPVPAAARPLLKRCLDKNSKRRLRDIGDALPLLEMKVPPFQWQWKFPKPWRWAVGSAVLLLAGAASYKQWSGALFPPPPPVRIELQSRPSTAFIDGSFPQISPDGRWVVFPAKGPDGLVRQWLRGLDSLEPIALAGTESPNPLPPPAFWSPDSRSIAFSYTALGSPGQLKRMSIAGGSPQVIAPIPTAAIGGTWNRDQTILIGSHYGGISRIPADGGTPVPVTVFDPLRGEKGHRMPQFLPDGRHFLYHRTARDERWTGVYIGDIALPPEQQSTEPLLVTNRNAVWVPSTGRGRDGYLLFLRGSVLLAQPFDTERLTGSPALVADQVGVFAYANVGLFTATPRALGYRVDNGTPNSPQVVILNWQSALAQ